MRTLKARLDLCSINTATLGYQTDIFETIDAVAARGFGAIAPWRRELDGEDIGTVNRKIRDSGLTVSGTCRSTYLPANSTAEFQANVEDNKRAIDQAAGLDAACFVIVSGSLPEGSRDLHGARAQVAEGIAQLAEHGREVGVRIALEPLHPMYANDRACLNTMEQALDLAEAVEPDGGGDPILGLAVDVYHVWWDPKLAEQVVRAGRQNRIFGFHVCDWLVPTQDLLMDRGMMGDGVVDIAGIRKQVEDAGYDGAVEVEIFSAENWWKRPIAETLDICAERLQNVC